MQKGKVTSLNNTVFKILLVFGTQIFQGIDCSESEITNRASYAYVRKPANTHNSWRRAEPPCVKYHTDYLICFLTFLEQNLDSLKLEFQHIRKYWHNKQPLPECHLDLKKSYMAWCRQLSVWKHSCCKVLSIAFLTGLFCSQQCTY